MAKSTQTVTALDDLGDIALLILSAPLFALGWLAGVTVLCLLWMWAAIVVGYRAGRGQPEREI
jgi:hypothetical protein